MSRKETELMILIQDIILAFVINTAATILNGGFSGIGNYLAGMMQAFCINYIAGLIIPVDRIGRAVAGAIRLKDGTLPFKLVRIFIINAIFVTIISFTIALINAGLTANIVSIWIRTYPALHIVGFVASVLVEAPVINLTKTICEKN